MQHVTALIPAGLGAALALLGVVALKEDAMHAAAALGWLGLIGVLIRPVRTLATGGEVNAGALASQLVTALVCLAFVGLCVNSFIQARRRRAGVETPR